ncbi:hypothetical protein, partial [Mesorhizobium sp. M7A.F.Ca.CA.001.16.1.1]|uniref:hypothetical protein n=3 Tax=Mesorhizobium TaxID=68287 RepID=UPI0019D4C596
GVRLPAVAEHMAEFVPELVGELRPVTLADISTMIQAILLPSGCSQIAGVPEVCSSTRRRVGWRSDSRRTPSRHACRMRSTT